jgi:hypothetical protein
MILPETINKTLLAQSEIFSRLGKNLKELTKGNVYEYEIEEDLSIIKTLIRGGDIEAVVSDSVREIRKLKEVV